MTNILTPSQFNLPDNLMICYPFMELYQQTISQVGRDPFEDSWNFPGEEGYLPNHLISDWNNISIIEMVCQTISINRRMIDIYRHSYSFNEVFELVSTSLMPFFQEFMLQKIDVLIQYLEDSELMVMKKDEIADRYYFLDYMGNTVDFHSHFDELETHFITMLSMNFISLIIGHFPEVIDRILLLPRDVNVYIWASSLQFTYPKYEKSKFAYVANQIIEDNGTGHLQLEVLCQGQ